MWSADLLLQQGESRIQDRRVPMESGARSFQTNGVKGFSVLYGALLRGQPPAVAQEPESRARFCVLGWPPAPLPPSPSLPNYLLSDQGWRSVERAPMPCYVYYSSIPFCPPKAQGQVWSLEIRVIHGGGCSLRVGQFAQSREECSSGMFLRL